MFLFMTYGTFWKGCTSFKYDHRLISYSNYWALALMCTYSLVYPADLVCGCRQDVNECSIDSVNHIGDRHWYCRFHWLMAHNPHRSKFRIDSNNTEREKITAAWVNFEYNIYILYLPLYYHYYEISVVVLGNFSPADLCDLLLHSNLSYPKSSCHSSESLVPIFWKNVTLEMKEGEGVASLRQQFNTHSYRGKGTGGARVLFWWCICCMVLCIDMPPRVPIPKVCKFG